MIVHESRNSAFRRPFGAAETGTEVYVAPCYKLTYDADGYCVKTETCHIPEEIAAKLAELNK